MIIDDNTQVVLNIGYLIGIVVLIWKVAKWQANVDNELADCKTTMRSEIEIMQSNIKSYEPRLSEVEHEHIDFKIEMAKIDTKLSGIETGIIELKELYKGNR